MLKNFTYLYHKYKDLILIFILGLVPLLWYGLDPNMFIASNDVGSSMNPVDIAINRMFAWHSGINFGVSQSGTSGSIVYYGLEGLTTLLTGSIFTGQKIVVILWFLVPMLVLYLFLQRITAFKNIPYMALFATILFQFNHFQQHAWRVYWRARFATYMLLPIVLLLLIDYLEGRRKLLKTIVLLGLSVFILNAGGSPPVFGADILLVPVTIIYFLVIGFPDKFFLYLKRSLLFILVGGITSAIMSAYWLLPYAYNALRVYSATIDLVGGLEATVGWTNVVSVNSSVLNLIRNVGLPFWDSSLPEPNFFLTHPVPIIISFIWAALTLSAIFFAKIREEKKYILLFLLLFIVGVVFTAGTHAPLKDFYLFFLFHIPGYVMFRSPLYKFGNLVWFTNSILIAFSLGSIIEMVRKHLINKGYLLANIKILLPLFILVVIFLWNYPEFNSKFFGWRPPLTTMEKIPSYVLDFGKWIDKNGDFASRILLLPEMNDSWHAEAYQWGYWSSGAQLMMMLTTKNAVSNDAHAYGTGQLIISISTDRLYKLMKNDDPSWPSFMKGLNIRYFLLRRDYFSDLDWMPTTSPYHYEQILSRNKDVEKIQTFGQWDLYRIKTLEPAQKISLDTQPILYEENQDDILQLFSFVGQNYQTSITKNFFISANDFPTSIKQKSVIAVPGPIDLLLPPQKDGLVLPKPKYLPGSPLYFLVKNKEEELVKHISNPLEVAEVYINLSVQRMAEMNELIQLKADRNNIGFVSEEYNTLLKSIEKNTVKLLESKKDVDKILIRTKWFLSEEQKIVRKWIDEKTYPAIKNSLKQNDKYLNDTIAKIPITEEQTLAVSGKNNAYYDPDIVFITPDYKWRIPQSGQYEVYIRGSSILANSKKLIINIDEKVIEVNVNIDKKENDWQKIGEIVFEEGEHGLQINADGDNISSIQRYDLVFFMKKDNLNISTDNAQITYRRINPTRYNVTLKTDVPAILVFDDKFDQDWKVFYLEPPQKNNSKDNGRKLTVIDFDKIKSTVNENFYNTWGKNPLPEGRHFKVNGYANAWYIDPVNDVKGNEVELVIEYLPQRIFYYSFLINIVAIIASITYLIIAHFKH